MTDERARHSSANERPLSYGVALGWAVAAAVLLVVVTRVLVTFRPAARLDLVSLTACEALVYVLAAFGVLRLHDAGRSARDALGIRLGHPALSVLGLGLGLSLLFPVESIRQLVERRFPTPPEELAQRALLFSPEGLPAQIALVLSVACVGPLVEELFFRGALFGSLRKHHFAPGAAITVAIAFTISHLDFRAWPALLIVAAVLSHLRAASGSLMPCLALHVGFNAASVIAMITGVSSVTRPLVVPPLAIIAGWALTLALVFAVHRLAQSSELAGDARAEDGP